MGGEEAAPAPALQLVALVQRVRRPQQSVAERKTAATAREAGTGEGGTHGPHGAEE